MKQIYFLFIFFPKIESQVVFLFSFSFFYGTGFAVRPLSREITLSQAYQNMCAGMYKVNVVFHLTVFTRTVNVGITFWIQLLYVAY